MNPIFMVTVLLAAGLQINFAADPDLLKLAAANNTFAFKLLKQMASPHLLIQVL